MSKRFFGLCDQQRIYFNEETLEFFNESGESLGRGWNIYDYYDSRRDRDADEFHRRLSEIFNLGD